MKIDKEAIQKLIDILNKNNLSEIEVKNGSKSIKVAKSKVQPSYIASTSEQTSDSISLSDSNNKELKVSSKINKEDTIKAPMLGTLYHASSPKAEPFIKKGTKVKKGDVIFIIEAMKTMNQVKSDRNGTVKQILVENGIPVEFDQDLVIINQKKCLKKY